MRWRSHIWRLAADRQWDRSRLARELGVSRVTLWRVQNGHTTPSPKLLFASARVFMRPVGDLWWQEQAPEPEPDAVAV